MMSNEQVAAMRAADEIQSHSFGAPINDLRFSLEQITDYIALLEHNALTPAPPVGETVEGSATVGRCRDVL